MNLTATRKPKRTTFTFQPAQDVESLVNKAVNKLKRPKGHRNYQQIDARGLRTLVINEALRKGLTEYLGKREGNLA